VDSQVTFLLKLIWSSPSKRNHLLSTFYRWIQDGASRNDVKDKLPGVIDGYLAEHIISPANEIDLHHMNWDHFTEFLCTCFYSKLLRSSLPDVPSDEIWTKLTNSKDWGALSLHPQQDKAIKETVPVPLFPLEQKLLLFGGTRMIFRYEPDLKLLLNRGELFDEPAELVPGEPSQCHLNVARLWNEQKGEVSIVTGYALSEDNLWRQHSWLIHEKLTTGRYRLIETTVKRVKYFGVILTEIEAKGFYKRTLGFPANL
jgi:hypothetical protein